MADDKKDEKKDECLSAATFDIKVCKHEEKEPEQKEDPKPKPNIFIKVVIPITITLGVTWQMTISGSSPVGTQSVRLSRPSASVSISSQKVSVQSRAIGLSTKGASSTPSVPNQIPRQVLTQYRDSIKAYLLDGRALETGKIQANEPTIWSDELLDYLSQQTDLLTFLNKLSGAIANHDADFIATHRSAQTSFHALETYSQDRTVVFVQQHLVQENIQTTLTSTSEQDKTASGLETLVAQALNNGCMPYPNLEFVASQWLCPLIASDPPLATEAASQNVKLGLINGENVNIRATPTIEGDIIGTGSYEFVLVDDSLMPSEASLQPGASPYQDNNPYKTQTNTLESEWYPIILGNTTGYIYRPYLTLYSNEGLLLTKDHDRWSFAIIATQ